MQNHSMREMVNPIAVCRTLKAASCGLAMVSKSTKAPLPLVRVKLRRLRFRQPRASFNRSGLALIAFLFP